MASPGRLRHRVTVQAPVTTQGDTGEARTSWEDVATVWAAVEPVGGSELVKAERLEARATVRVRMRYLAGLTNEHRILHGSRVLEIVQIVNPMERNAELELLCTESA